MTRRRPQTLDFFEADDHRGTWRVREHSRLKRQWRFIRRLPGIVQVLLAQLVLAYALIVGFVAWLVVGGLTFQP